MEKLKFIDEVAARYAEGVINCNPDHKESICLIHTAVVYGANHAWQELEVMDFSDALKALKQFKCIRRKGWNGKGLMVFRQVPAHITSDIIPKMQSVPDSAKKLIADTANVIDYTSQCLIYNTATGRADSWVPSSSDLMAADWEVVPSEE